VINDPPARRWRSVRPGDSSGGNEATGRGHPHDDDVTKTTTSTLLLTGAALTVVGGIIGLAGAAITTVAAAAAARRRIERMEVPPSVLARREWRRARTAVTAGAGAWRNGEAPPLT